MGEQLRTLPFGRFKGENYYYFGGTRVYRSKNLSKKDSKKYSYILYHFLDIIVSLSFSSSH